MKSLVLLMAVVLALGAKTCQKYEKSDKLDVNVCVKNDSKTVFVRPCTDSKYCDFEKLDNNIGSCKDPPKRQISEYCTTSKDCFSGTCKDGKFCKGKDENADCDTDKNDCDVGLYCAKHDNITYKCEKAKEAGKDCMSDAECRVPNFCVNKKCAPPLSADVNQVVYDRRACKTYFMELKDTGNVCANSCKYGKTDNKVTTPPICRANGTCEYRKNGIDEELSCDCGRTSNGTVYCKLFPIEFDLKDYINFFKNANYTEQHRTCAPFCLRKGFKDMGTDFFKAFTISIRAHKAHFLENNSEEVKKIYNKAYWEAMDILNKKSVDNNKFMMYLIIGISGGVVLIAAIVIVIICLRRRNSTEEAGLME
eukprot:TRINITY_DN1205_c0_g2_i14.p1 TRINITY_DN1205_c0_g2~~TRINITY_DN1205_c0_g2_i14.p1  ORF type:complete len:365 (+),score=83.44 TRINITY_DN1205_c0_g2_i14:202-1296(+)